MVATKSYTRQRKTKQVEPWLRPAKFQIGEIVYHDFLVQDDHDKRNGQVFRDYGQITGLYWSIPNCGWIYFIRWTECNSYPESAGIVDELPEEYLTSLKGSKNLAELKVISAVELFDNFIAAKSRKLDPRTLEKYRAARTRLAEFFKDKPIDFVTAAKAEAYLEFAKTFQAPRTVHDRLTILRSCWDWGIRAGQCCCNPWNDLEIKVPPKQRPKPFTRDEITAILEAFSTGSYTSYKPYVTFLFLTGCRTAEAIGLRWRHIADDFGSIWIGETISRGKAKSTKTNRDRTFPCNDRLADFLRSIKPATAQPDDLVFAAPKGGALDDQNFCKRVWRPMLEKANVIYRRPYTTRHSFISHCLANGMPPVEVASITGHDVQVLFRHYAGVISSRPKVPDFI